MDTTPNTFNYLVSGYIVFSVVMLVYLVSLVSRWNNLKREQQVLEEIEKSA